ncbi:MAG: Hsp20/alpha crystallin family protein [Gammaproteobacteria bacterium]|nr:Hsp20/alpha crystallin family protein [Gammaproteobacteria bacterium]
MKLTKLNPWNWFKHEQENESKPVAVQRAVNPLASFSEMQRDMNALFDRAWRQVGFPGLDWPSALPTSGELGMLKPKVDIASSDKEYCISVEVPGVDEDQLHLEMADGALIVRGEKQQNREVKEHDMQLVERSYGSFERYLSLPADANSDNIDASFNNGVLNITLLRKAAEMRDGQKIEIKRAS